MARSDAAGPKSSAQLTVAPAGRNGPIQHLFADSDTGGEHWATLPSLVETCKLNGVEPESYLADVLTRLVNHHPNSRLDELLT